MSCSQQHIGQLTRGGNPVLGLGCFLLSPNLSALWFSRSPPATLISPNEAITKKKMKPFGDKLTNEEIKVLVAHVRTFKK